MGPYELHDLIGGGMSLVYRACHRETGEPAAIKVLKEDAAADSALLERFHRESAALMRVRHPHIVRGLETGEMAGRPYLVMEYVDGPTLGQRIFREGPLPLEEALRLFSQVGAALDYLHQEGLVHRDVKPDNILLTGEGQAKLADLGLSKDLRVEGEITSYRAGLGTLAYAAPEQFESAATADARSDVYALGASLYHGLTGVAPFQGQVTLVVLRAKLTNDFLPPGRLLPHIPAGVDYAICRSLSPDPEERPASCAELLDSLLNLKPVRLASTPKASNRRGAARFPSLMQAVCAPAYESRSRWPGAVRDLSLTGVCLELGRRLDPGADIRVELHDDTLQPIFGAVVRWVRPTSSGRWLHGCQFRTAMTEHELLVLLGGLKKTEQMAR